MKAHEFLEAGIGHMKDRAATYDAPSGERSMEKTVAIFNELLAEKLRSPLSEEDGWNFMEILKLVRSKQGEFKADSYEDRAAYAGLAGEAAASEYRSFRDEWYNSTASADIYSFGITIATQEKGGPMAVWSYSINLSAAEHIERHRKCRAMLIWVNGMAVYDSFTAKEGDLDRIVGHLKNERD